VHDGGARIFSAGLPKEKYIGKSLTVQAVTGAVIAAH
jgi:hypothetical protein